MKSTVVAMGGMLAASGALAQTIGFDNDTPGMLPPSWQQGVTGRGDPRWAVRQDASAPSRPNVLQQSGSGTFPWCVLRNSSLENGFVEVKFKPLEGREDQAGGVLWRWKDGNNYYVARANALENNVSLYYTANGRRNIVAREANVFDDLRHLEKSGERFDTIVLDPPAFAKNKAAVPKALAGYKEINLRALRLLTPGGCLITCSCSYNVDEATFAEVVYDASIDSRAQVTVVEKRMQSRDHPVLLGVPETYYLKCLILRKLA